MKKTIGLLIILGQLLLFNSNGFGKDLKNLIPGLHGGDGIFLATAPAASHTAHFGIASEEAINALNKQISSEIAAFPFSSSEAGFTFSFDDELGTFVPSTQTLGPIFAERASTIGQGKLNLNFSYTRFKYTKFGGRSLNNFSVTARHDPDVIGFPDRRDQFENDLVLLDVDIDINVQIFNLGATYGVSDKFDVGFILPITSVDMDVKSSARVEVSPLNTRFPNIHTFEDGPEPSEDSASDSAIGLGDLVLRAKYRFLEDGPVDIAGVFITQLATGDEDNFLGTGNTSFRPFLVMSRAFTDDIFTFGLMDIVVTPHLNLGYEFNTGRYHQSAVESVVGFDAGTPKFTFAAEVLASNETDGDGIGDDIVDTSLGFKWTPLKNLFVSGNVILPLNDAGLRADVIPTVSLEYVF